MFTQRWNLLMTHFSECIPLRLYSVSVGNILSCSPFWKIGTLNQFHSWQLSQHQHVCTCQLCNWHRPVISCVYVKIFIELVAKNKRPKGEAKHICLRPKGIAILKALMQAETRLVLRWGGEEKRWWWEREAEWSQESKEGNSMAVNKLTRWC